jgi:hypothetical protein
MRHSEVDTNGPPEREGSTANKIFFLPSPLGFRQVDPHAKFECSMFALIVALEFILFFPSNARWLSPGRLASRKDNCSLQIHRINAVATSVMTTMSIQKGPE